MKSFVFWQRWLLIVGIILSVFGIMMALLSGTPLFDLFNRQIDPAFWKAGTVDGATRQFQTWIYGVWGATIAGWGVFMSFIVHYPLRRKERWSWNCLVLGLLAWFILDTSLSLFHAVYFNVIFNSALIIVVGLPVIFTKKAFA
jgi:hypothetical protein